MDELSVKCFLYADDQIILAPSACELHAIVTKMKNVKKRDMKVNVSKTNRTGESANFAVEPTGMAVCQPLPSSRLYKRLLRSRPSVIPSAEITGIGFP
ncbi:hypothetical protein EVAR_40279_1 [Eumeta japonica]|uniref:Reverse transcriptase domain-containing protein n=1 Tax=Eumeta variegata TaxID=151549 RepID=A0A4C1WVD6_EUMVA|nr:hypothetical protein EVAR_40279_1 [Eumeta japonica]